MKTLTARAYDNLVFVAACNEAGGLLVLNPKGEILAEDFLGEDRLLFCSIHLAERRRILKGGSMTNRYFIFGTRLELYGEILGIKES